jgi:hypothetical protein
MAQEATLHQLKKDQPKLPQTVVTPEETPGRRTAGKPSRAPSASEITGLKSKGLVEFKGCGKPPVANDICADNT